MTGATRALVVAAVVLTAAAGGAAVYRLMPARYATTAQMSSVRTTAANQHPEGPRGAEQPAQEESRAQHAIPDSLPDFSLPDAEGTSHKLSDWKGRPLLVNFWATWCAPCRREIPLLSWLHQKRSAQGLEIIGIAVDFHDAVVKYARDMRIDYPVLIGEQGGFEAASAFGMEPVFPFSVFADRQGRIVALKIGELHREEANLILDRLADVEGGRLDLKEARSRISEGLAHLAADRARAEPSSM